MNTKSTAQKNGFFHTILAIGKDAFIINRYTYLEQFRWHKGRNKKRVKNTYIFFGMIILIFSMNSYSTYTQYATDGFEQLIIPSLFTYGSLFPILINSLRAFSYLFENKQDDDLLSLPVASESVLLSKLLALYEIQLIFTLPIMLVGGVAYLFSIQAFLYIPLYIFGSFVAPLVPLVFSVGISFLVSLLPFKKNSQLVAGLLLGFGSFYLTNAFLVVESPAVSGDMINTSSYAYPLTILFSKGMEGNWLYYIAFIVVSIATFAVFFLFIRKKYFALRERMKKEVRAKKKTQAELPVLTPRKALEKKETSLWKGSTIYAANTAMGVILALALAIAIGIFGFEKGAEKLSLLPYIDKLYIVLPYILSGLLIASTPSYVAISIEGKRAWILQSLPIEKKDLIESKKALTYKMHIIALCGLVIVMLLRSQMPYMGVLYLIGITSTFSYFINTFSLLLGNQFRKFDWANENEIVKQNFIVPLLMLVGMILLFIPGVFSFFNPHWVIFITVFACGAYVLLGKICDKILYDTYYI